MSTSTKRLIFVLITVLFEINNAQLLVPLHGSCTSSVQCIGVAICVQAVCQCPPVYAAIGITCIYSGMEAPLDGPIFPLPVPAPLPASVAVHAPASHLAHGPFPQAHAIPVPVPPVAGPGVFAYPGASCSTAKSCVGGSFCYQGSCGCPSGYIVSGYSCVQHNIVEPAPVPIAAPVQPRPVFSQPAPVFAHGPGPEPFFPAVNGPAPTFFGQISEQFLTNSHGSHGGHGGPDFGPGPAPLPFGFNPNAGPLPCPAQQVLIGSSCLPQAVVAKLPAGILCTNGGGCTGGSSCVNSVCTCPTNQVWGSSGCVVASKIPLPGPGLPYHPAPFVAPQPGPFAAPHPGPFAPLPFAPQPVPVSQAYPAAPALPAFPPVFPDAPNGIIALGSSCGNHYQCVAGAFCQLGVCACRPSYVPYGSVCILRRHKAKEETSERSERKKKN